MSNFVFKDGFEYQGKKVIIFVFQVLGFLLSNYRLKSKIADKNSKIVEENANCCAKVLIQLPSENKANKILFPAF